MPAPLLAVVVAHPDDEVVGVGGQLTRWARRVVCVYATDGAPPDGVDARAAGFADVQAYAAARMRESRAALRCAGIGDGRIAALGFPDQSLSYRLDELSVALACLLHDLRPAAVITHAYEGGHPDHDALSLVLGRVVHDWARTNGGAPELIEFAGYHEGATGALVTNRFAAVHPSDVRLRMSAAQRRQKNTMLACFATQRAVLRPFISAEEWLRRAPWHRYDQPPNNGRVWYDRFRCGIRSSEWLARAAAFSRTHLHTTGVGSTC